MVEESLLANIWLGVHEDNDQGVHRSFWNVVTQRFNDQTDGVHRTKNSIAGEWSRIDLECRRYNAVYKELKRTSEDPICLSNVNRVYYERYGKAIKYQHVWFVLRNTWVWDRDD